MSELRLPDQSSIVIRLANGSDLDELVRLEQTCFAIPWSRQSLQSDLDDPQRAKLWVAASQGPDILGYVACYHAADQAQITNLAVDPLARRHGVGRQLLNTLLDWAKASGVKTVDLEVRVSNAAAIALYTEAGFVTVGHRPRYYTDNGEDANIMLKSIH